MSFEMGTLPDPVSEQGYFLWRKSAKMGVGRRHLVTGIVRRDAPDHFGPLRMTGDYCEGAFGDLQGREGAVGDVESQMGFPVVGVGAVAFKTFVRENGSDVEVIADLFCGSGVVVVVQAGGKNKDGSCDQGRYGSNAADGSRFTLKIR